MNKKAFTLIELLVVVLIIGILAAIALPQYQKAVMKTRYAGLKNLTRSLAEAQEIYYLANNSYASRLDELDIGVMGEGENSPYYDESTKNFTAFYPWGYCKIKNDYVYCQNVPIDMAYQIFYQHAPSNAGTTNCLVYASDTSNSLQAQICKSETGKTSSSYSYTY